LAGTQYRTLTTAIKQVFKNKGVIYATLAARVGLSESGLKKVLSAEDGSIGRLEAICLAIGMTLFDLMQIAHGELSVTEFEMPSEVQEYFLANLDCFRFFWMLIYDEYEPDRILSDLNMDSHEFWKHVRQLDRFGLLKVGENNRITIPNRDHIVWVNDGPLVEWMKKNWSFDLLSDAVANDKNADHYLSMRVFRLSEASRKDLVQALRDINREFGHRSLRERLSYPDDQLASIRVLSTVAPGSFALPTK
jgi:hypothetical protein